MRMSERDLSDYTRRYAGTPDSLHQAITAANAKATPKKRASAFKHAVQYGRHTINLTDEGLEQYTVAQWLRWKGYKFLHIPNERKCSFLEGIMLKMLGLEPGAADFLIFSTPPNFAFKGVALEMKSLTGTATANQQEWHAGMSAIGWLTCIAQGSKTAISFLENHGY